MQSASLAKSPPAQVAQEEEEKQQATTDLLIKQTRSQVLQRISQIHKLASLALPTAEGMSTENQAFQRSANQILAHHQQLVKKKSTPLGPAMDILHQAFMRLLLSYYDKENVFADRFLQLGVKKSKFVPFLAQKLTTDYALHPPTAADHARKLYQLRWLTAREIAPEWLEQCDFVSLAIRQRDLPMLSFGARWDARPASGLINATPLAYLIDEVARPTTALAPQQQADIEYLLTRLLEVDAASVAVPIQRRFYQQTRQVVQQKSCLYQENTVRCERVCRQQQFSSAISYFLNQVPESTFTATLLNKLLDAPTTQPLVTRRLPTPWLQLGVQQKKYGFAQAIANKYPQTVNQPGGGGMTALALLLARADKANVAETPQLLMLMSTLLTQGADCQACLKPFQLAMLQLEAASTSFKTTKKRSILQPSSDATCLKKLIQLQHGKNVPLKKQLLSVVETHFPPTKRLENTNSTPLPKRIAHHPPAKKSKGFFANQKNKKQKKKAKNVKKPTIKAKQQHKHKKPKKVAKKPAQKEDNTLIEDTIKTKSDSIIAPNDSGALITDRCGNPDTPPLLPPFPPLSPMTASPAGQTTTTVNTAAICLSAIVPASLKTSSPPKGPVKDSLSDKKTITSCTSTTSSQKQHEAEKEASFSSDSSEEEGQPNTQCTTSPKKKKRKRKKKPLATTQQQDNKTVSSSTFIARHSNVGASTPSAAPKIVKEKKSDTQHSSPFVQKSSATQHPTKHRRSHHRSNRKSKTLLSNSAPLPPVVPEQRTDNPTALTISQEQQQATPKPFQTLAEVGVYAVKNLDADTISIRDAYIPNEDNHQRHNGITNRSGSNSQQPYNYGATNNYTPITNTQPMLQPASTMLLPLQQLNLLPISSNNAIPSFRQSTPLNGFSQVRVNTPPTINLNALVPLFTNSTIVSSSDTTSPPTSNSLGGTPPQSILHQTLFPNATFQLPHPPAFVQGQLPNNVNASQALQQHALAQSHVLPVLVQSPTPPPQGKVNGAKQAYRRHQLLQLHTKVMGALGACGCYNYYNELSKPLLIKRDALRLTTISEVYQYFSRALQELGELPGGWTDDESRPIDALKAFHQQTIAVDTLYGHLERFKKNIRQAVLSGQNIKNGDQFPYTIDYLLSKHQDGERATAIILTGLLASKGSELLHPEKDKVGYTTLLHAAVALNDSRLIDWLFEWDEHLNTKISLRCYNHPKGGYDQLGTPLQWALNNLGNRLLERQPFQAIQANRRIIDRLQQGSIDKQTTLSFPQHILDDKPYGEKLLATLQKTGAKLFIKKQW